MVRAAAEKAIIDIYQYFRYQKAPTDIQIDQWYEKIKFIPDIAVDWIVSCITDMDKLPPNLPKEFVRQWYSYRKVHKDKSIAEQFEYCDDCSGHGTHLFKKLEDMYNPPMWISYIAMCAKCNNWMKQFGRVCRDGGNIYIDGKPTGGYVRKVWLTTKQEIIDKGYKYLSQHDPNEKMIIPGDVKTLAGNTLKGV